MSLFYLIRPYSCASYSPDGKAVDFVFNVVDIPTGNGRCYSRQGICTGYLRNIINNHEKSDQKLMVFARQNKNFRLPENLEVPFIMIGPGGFHTQVFS
jgi:sulfite reductase alpha subunit-like flavoprotein